MRPFALAASGASPNYEKSTITGDPKTFGTVYIGKRGIMVGTSSN